MNAHITLLCDTHTTTQQEIIDIKGVFQSYYMKKYTLIHFEIQKKVNCSWSISVLKILTSRYYFLKIKSGVLLFKNKIWGVIKNCKLYN